MSEKVVHIAEGLRRRWRRQGYDPRRYNLDAAVAKAKDIFAIKVARAGLDAVKARHKAAGTCDPADLLLLRRKHQDWIECPACGYGVDAALHANWSPEHYAAIVATRGEPATWPRRRPRETAPR